MTIQSIQAAWEELQHHAHLELQECMCHPIAFHVGMMRDIMHMHQAICQPDVPEFVKAMIREML